MKITALMTITDLMGMAWEMSEGSSDPKLSKLLEIIGNLLEDTHVTAWAEQDLEDYILDVVGEALSDDG